LNTGSDHRDGVGQGRPGKLPRAKFQLAAEACTKATLTEPARTLLNPGAAVGEFLQLLMSRELMTDAVALLAHALPSREAVWWACLAARAVVDRHTSNEVQTALEAAEAWVYTPTEENRRAAMERARLTQFDHPAVWAAVGAFWSGGSMVAPDLPAVPPAEHLTGLAVCGAVQLSVLCREPERAGERFAVLLKQGIDIANGGNGRARSTG
jgi:hypothetical protein